MPAASATRIKYVGNTELPLLFVTEPSSKVVDEDSRYRARAICAVSTKQQKPVFQYGIEKVDEDGHGIDMRVAVAGQDFLAAYRAMRLADIMPSIDSGELSVLANILDRDNIPRSEQTRLVKIDVIKRVGRDTFDQVRRCCPQDLDEVRHLLASHNYFPLSFTFGGV